MYPKLPELIKYLKSLEATKSIFFGNKWSGTRYDTKT